MSLKDIISIKGKPGLFKLLKITRTGLLLETLDNEKKKLIKSINFSLTTPLDNIAIYKKNNPTDAIPLMDIFLNIEENKSLIENINLKTPPQEIQKIMKEITPDYDDKRLHPSQIIKIIQWFKIISEHCKGFFNIKPNVKEQKKNNPSKPKKTS